MKEVKDRLAKNRIAIPIKRLLNSLVTPIIQLRNADDLPKPGHGLMQNPFEEDAETKKKSGKKR